MKWFNGKGGVIAKATAIVTLVTGILVLNWNVTDRVKAGDDRAKKEAIEVAKAEDERLETQFVSSLDKFQRQQMTQYWLNIRDQARTQLRRINRELSSHPDDPFLLDEKTYWQELYNKSNRKLDELLNP
jgi:hypothetical protein